MEKFERTVSVVICTFGPHPCLFKVLDSLKNQTFKSFQIIIIDNNEKKSDFSELILGLVDIKIIHLSRPNLSEARNIAIKNCDRDLILFLDDDAIPAKDWVEKIVEGFKKYNSDMIGGRIDLSLQKKEPKWFTKSCRLYLSELTYYNNDIEIIIPPRYLVGANMAFSKDTFQKFGLFLKDSGHIGKRLISLEDVEMVRRIYNMGGKVTYLNFAKVDHIILAPRITMVYLIKRAFWQGISDIILENKQPLNEKKLKKIPLDFTFLLEIMRRLGRLFYRIKSIID